MYSIFCAWLTLSEVACDLWFCEGGERPSLYVSQRVLIVLISFILLWCLLFLLFKKKILRSVINSRHPDHEQQGWDEYGRNAETDWKVSSLSKSNSLCFHDVLALLIFLNDSWTTKNFFHSFISFPFFLNPCFPLKELVSEIINGLCQISRANEPIRLGVFSTGMKVEPTSLMVWSHTTLSTSEQLRK